MKSINIGALVLCVVSSTGVLAEIDSPDAMVVENKDMYIGLDLFRGSSEFDVGLENTADFDQKGFRIKVGKEIEKGLRLQGYFKKETNEEFTRDLDFGEAITFDKEIAGFGGDLVKTFAGLESVSPFVQAGISFDFRELESTSGIELSEDAQVAVGLKLGLGVTYKINNQFELLGGFDWQYRTWQEIEFVGVDVDSIEIDDTSKCLYAGINYFF